MGREHHYPHDIIGANRSLAHFYLRLNLSHQARHHLVQSIETALIFAKKNIYNQLLLALSDYFQAQSDYEKGADLFFTYIRYNQIDIEAKKKIERLQAALQSHFSADAWAALENQAVEDDLDLLLNDLLAELQS